MSMVLRAHERLGRVQIPFTEKHEKLLTEKILLKFARLAILLLLSMVGFLFNSYLSSMNKAIDNMAASIEKISDTQEHLAIMIARIDESVRHLEKRNP